MLETSAHSFDNCTAQIYTPWVHSAWCGHLFHAILYTVEKFTIGHVAAWRSAAGSIASPTRTLFGVASKSNDLEKQNFFAQVEWLPLTSRSRTHGLTDNYKISIMIVVFVFTPCTHVQMLMIASCKSLGVSMKISVPSIIIHIMLMDIFL